MHPIMLWLPAIGLARYREIVRLAAQAKAPGELFTTSLGWFTAYAPAGPDDSFPALLRENGFVTVAWTAREYGITTSDYPDTLRRLLAKERAAAVEYGGMVACGESSGRFARAAKRCRQHAARLAAELAATQRTSLDGMPRTPTWDTADYAACDK